VTASGNLASSTLGEGPNGISLVFSLTRLISFGLLARHGRATKSLTMDSKSPHIILIQQEAGGRKLESWKQTRCQKHVWGYSSFQLSLSQPSRFYTISALTRVAR